MEDHSGRYDSTAEENCPIASPGIGCEALCSRRTSEKVQGVFMEYRQLGKSGLRVPELCFGAGTFGTSGEFFQAWSKTSDDEATRIVDICMDAGLNFFDTADIYSNGGSETALGKAIAHHKREDVLLSTKATFRFGNGPNDVGSSRYHLLQSLERSLQRLGTDYVDVYHLHGFDATTPVDET